MALVVVDNIAVEAVADNSFAVAVAVGVVDNRADDIAAAADADRISAADCYCTDCYCQRRASDY